MKPVGSRCRTGVPDIALGEKYEGFVASLRFEDSGLKMLGRGCEIEHDRFLLTLRVSRH
jgi:hypothetical protein